MSAKMEYHSMSLVDLKKVVREKKLPIKHYYVMKRIDLIRILTMKEIPQEYSVQKKTIAELRKEAHERGHKNIWKLKKSELTELLYPGPNKDNKDNNHAKEHDDPK
jgi:hypothetical protein